MHGGNFNVRNRNVREELTGLPGLNKLSYVIHPRDVHGLNKISANDLNELSVNGLNALSGNVCPRDLRGLNVLTVNVCPHNLHGLNELSVNNLPCDVIEFGCVTSDIVLYGMNVLGL